MNNDAPKKRRQCSLILSARRSWLFNLVLSERVEKRNRDQYLSGDMMQLAGSHACFSAQEEDREINSRLTDVDIHPTGLLWGVDR